MRDVIIVGSGLAGVGAALELADRGVRPLLLDVGVGKPAGQPRADANLYAFKAERDSFDLTIGRDFRGLYNVLSERPIPVKLTGPNVGFVTEGAERIAPIEERQFTAIQSFAAGGLANAWGAGLYRFTDRDMERFPIAASDLDPYFDKLTAEIGISGVDDELTPFFGSAEGLQPPVRLSANMRRLYEKYRRVKDRLPGGFHLGHPRIGVLTEPKSGRSAFDYTNLEFWQESRAIYNPRFTLEDMVRDERVDYVPKVLVHSWREEGGSVAVQCANVDTNEPLSFTCRRLVLAAGVINTSRIVLRSFGDQTTQLPLLENPAVQIPFVLPGCLAQRLETDAFGLVGLNLIWESREYDAVCQGSVMEITSPRRAEFFASLPYSARANIPLLRHLLPAMFVMQFYLPGSSQEPSLLSLRDDGALRIQGHPNAIDLGKAGPMFAFFRRLGAWSHRALVLRVPMGHAVHYSGTLPMKSDPGRYQCDRSGRLNGTANVYIADSASLSDLPAKNMSFGMMANAMRIAAGVSDGLGGEA